MTGIVSISAELLFFNKDDKIFHLMNCLSCHRMHVSSGCTNSALTKDTLLADTEEQTALLALIVPHGACCGDKNVILAATFSYSYQDHIYSSPEYFLVADPLMHYS